MMVIMDAIRQISALRPAELPAVPTPRMPDVSSVHELARITDGTPEKILRAVDSLRADSAQIEKLQREARHLAEAVDDVIDRPPGETGAPGGQEQRRRRLGAG